MSYQFEFAESVSEHLEALAANERAEALHFVDENRFMKAIEISTVNKSLADYAGELDDFVVLTSDNKPFAAIVSLKNLDPESVALSTNA